MYKIRFCLGLMCVLAGFVAMPLNAQISNSDIEEKLKAIVAKHQSVGLAVVVVKDNQVQYVKSLGYSDLENIIMLNDDNLFRIASISKSFTTSALLQLVERGELSLQDNVSELIGFPVVNPHYPDEAITLQMLLAHTSSLNDSQQYGALDIIHPAKNMSYAKSYSDYPPGSKHVYSNMGYNLAGAILEKLSGKRFDMVIREQILNPLGMDAGFNVDSLDQSKFASLYPYDRSKKSFRKSESAYARSAVYDAIDAQDYVLGYTGARFSPTGGLKVSALDLAKYMQMHMNFGIYEGRRVLSETSSALMQRTFATVNEQRDYGLGLRIARDLVDGVTFVGHTGLAQGLNSAMFFEPYQKFGFVVITNGTSAARQRDGYNPVLQETIQALYQHFIQQ